ncbi:MAG TPA: preprotein translocase subunit SecG [Sphingomonadaceae bacterium]|nr:preprotein translocase subunit SecG [Sphingomonadaceae bacterium]
MPLFQFLTVVQALVAAALVAVVLMQRSEGGGLGLGGGGSPAGLMSARGAADFLTRATAILATLFVVLSIVLAAIAVGGTSNREVDATLDRTVTPANNGQSDLIGAAAAPSGAASAETASGSAQPASGDPLQGAAQ